MCTTRQYSILNKFVLIKIPNLKCLGLLSKRMQYSMIKVHYNGLHVFTLKKKSFIFNTSLNFKYFDNFKFVKLILNSKDFLDFCKVFKQVVQLSSAVSVKYETKRMLEVD